jgi:serine protease Do
MDHSTDWISYVSIRALKKGEDVMGAQVTYNNPDNPLAKLGINSGDVVMNLNGHPLVGPQDLPWVIDELRNNTTLEFQLERGGKPTLLEIHLADN